MHLQKGDLVIFPTDTIYGVGCRIDREDSIKRLYEIRKTPLSKPTLILAADLNQVLNYGELDNFAEKLVSKFWPGPLTAILKATDNVPKIIQGPAASIGIRIPKQHLLREIIKRVGVPILAPSANFHTKRAPVSFSQIDKALLALVDYAIDLSSLDGAQVLSSLQSTLINLTKSPSEILREGAISRQEIEHLVEEPVK
ncbi:MAG: L-threonylcarbamoyladenylate synthase [Candidatus Woykebacteria bacterium]